MGSNSYLKLYTHKKARHLTQTHASIYRHMYVGCKFLFKFLFPCPYNQKKHTCTKFEGVAAVNVALCSLCRR